MLIKNTRLLLFLVARDIIYHISTSLSTTFLSENKYVFENDNIYYNTFTIIIQYKNRKISYHFFLYRLINSSSFNCNLITNHLTIPISIIAIDRQCAIKT